MMSSPASDELFESSAPDSGPASIGEARGEAKGEAITAIKSVGPDDSRFAVKVGRRRVAVVSAQTLSELSLAIGQRWDERLADRVEQRAAYDKARRDATRRLDRRALSKRELAEKLTAAGHAESVVDQVLTDVSKIGLLDDEALGRAIIEITVDRRAAGPNLLRQKLATRGIDSSLIDRLLDRGEGAAAESLEAAVSLARAKLASMTRLDPQSRTRRLWGLLQRRGYDEHTTEAALRSLGDEAELVLDHD